MNPTSSWQLVPPAPTQEWTNAFAARGPRIGSFGATIRDVLATAPAPGFELVDELLAVRAALAFLPPTDAAVIGLDRVIGNLNGCPEWAPASEPSTPASTVEPDPPPSSMARAIFGEQIGGHMDAMAGAPAAGDALPALDADLIEILGRPNFMCADLATLLRAGGHSIKRKAEHEQAALHKRVASWTLVCHTLDDVAPGWSDNRACGKDCASAAIRKLAGQRCALDAPASVRLLAANHNGMRVDYTGLLGQARSALKRGEAGPELAEMLRQLAVHLKELGQRWYAGDTGVVDELLQLYCVESAARAALAAQPAEEPATPQPSPAVTPCQTGAPGSAGTGNNDGGAANA